MTTTTQPSRSHVTCARRHHSNTWHTIATRPPIDPRIESHSIRQSANIVSRQRSYDVRQLSADHPSRDVDLACMQRPYPRAREPWARGGIIGRLHQFCMATIYRRQLPHRQNGITINRSSSSSSNTPGALENTPSIRLGLSSGHSLLDHHCCILLLMQINRRASAAETSRFE